MFPFYYQSRGVIYKAFEHKTQKIVDFWQWSNLPEGFHPLFVSGLQRRSDGCFFIRGTQKIYLFNPKQKTLELYYSLPKIGETGWTKELNDDGFIKQIKIRSIGDHEHLFFYVFQRSSYFQNGKEFRAWLYQLSNKKEPIICREILHSDLLVPDIWCNSGKELPHISPFFSFSVPIGGQDLFLAAGGQPPSAFYVIKGAGPHPFSAKPERFHVNLSTSCVDLNCHDDVTLYYQSWTDSSPDKKRVIRRIDRLPLPLVDEVVESFEERPAPPDGEISMRNFSLVKSELRWIQRSLNVVFPPSPLLEVNGIFDAKTRDALRKFQEYWLPSVKPSGLPGGPTRRKLVQVLKDHYGWES